MRHARTTIIMLTFAAALLVPAGAAFADSGSGDTSSVVTETKPPTETSSKPATDTSSKPPTDTSSKPPVDTSVPETETPTTTAPSCDDDSSCESTTTPVTPEVPTVTPETPNVTPEQPKVTPTTPNVVPDSAPGGGGQLPFTGPGDVLLAIVLALLAGTGGILFLMGASGREAIEGLSKRNMDSPSGFHVAYRELRKQQLDD
ncbi:MAG: hypothetical protein KDC46_08010 [Thermoleophilia bacterium]|nr:hypothetical protein [Thermoleophilia bacterium]